MPDFEKARAVGFNHVALEVGDIEEALASPSSGGLRSRQRTNEIH